MQRYAALDVGSNTVHLLVADSDGARLWPVHDETAVLDLAADLERYGQLSVEKVAEAVAALRRLANVAQGLQASRVDIVGTEVLRRAPNRDALLASAAAAGLPIRVITGEEEAAFTQCGAALEAPLDAPHLLLDVGGGSTEVILVRRGSSATVRSLPLGTGALAARYLAFEPPTAAERGRLEAEVAAALREARATGALGDAVGTVVATGGAARRVAAFLGLPEARGATSAPVLEGAVARLFTTEGGQAFGDRAGMVRVGGVILLATVRAWRASTLVISAAGLREGMIVTAARGNEAQR